MVDGCIHLRRRGLFLAGLRGDGGKGEDQGKSGKALMTANMASFIGGSIGMVILVFCAIGTYSLNNSVFEVGLMAAFGVLGYVFRKLGCEVAPLMLGFVVGPMFEENLRRAMLLSQGDPSVFVTRPISATLLGAAALLLIIVLLPAVKSKREEAFVEE